MDLGTHDTRAASEAGAPMRVYGPDGSLLMDGDEPVTITLCGADSPKFSAAQKAIAKRRGMQAARNGSDRELNDLIELMADVTVGWSGIDYLGQAPFPCTKANAIRLYTDLRWLLEQVISFVTERANYLGN